MFPEIDILEESEELVIADLDTLHFPERDLEISSSLALSPCSKKTPGQMLEEVEERRKLRREKKNQKRATVLVTSGAMTFLLMAATLVTASFLMSPTIEKIFGKQVLTSLHLII